MEPILYEFAPVKSLGVVAGLGIVDDLGVVEGPGKVKGLGKVNDLGVVKGGQSPEGSPLTHFSEFKTSVTLRQKN